MSKVYSSTRNIRETPYKELAKTIDTVSRHNHSMEHLDGGRDRLNLSMEVSEAKNSQGSPDYRGMYKNVQIRDMINSRTRAGFEGTVPNYSLQD